MKDLYEYWKGDIAQCILEDIQGEGSVKSGTDEFLVVNVASQEVREKVLGAGTLLLPTFKWLHAGVCSSAMHSGTMIALPPYQPFESLLCVWLRLV